jgi:hypothetical protein
MMTKTKMKSYVDIVRLLAILFSVILFPSTSAHVGMVHAATAGHHIDQTIDAPDPSMQQHDGMAHMSNSDAENLSSHHSDSSCCPGNCVTSVVLDQFIAEELIFKDYHFPRPFFELAAVNVHEFLRPPNL